MYIVIGRCDDGRHDITNQRCILELVSAGPDGDKISVEIGFVIDGNPVVRDIVQTNRASCSIFYPEMRPALRCAIHLRRPLVGKSIAEIIRVDNVRLITGWISGAY